ncbi:MAG: UDP-3-O-(3-hydroxymyristoyl)glucosamine N-acyltransferase [Ignavibacteria bacterium]|nr:UDP-3-O-(3-hydroxymyristoyl)glucosamine N-acyltransferase [Ignavibacteria bacterium]
MEITVEEIASLVGGEVVGDGKKIIRNVAKIEEAGEDDLTFLYQEKYEKYLSPDSSFAVLVNKDFSKSYPSLTFIKVAEPYLAFIKIIEKYFIPEVELPPLFSKTKDEVNFSFGKNFRCGENVSIGKNCKIGDDVTIFSNVAILNDVEIGDGTVIYPNVTIRERCKIGKRNIIHSGVVIGSDGFGYYKLSDKSYKKIPQIGIVVLEDDVEVGANTCIDRASIGETRIKKGTKIDNLVQIAHNVVIGENCAISGQTGFAGSTKVGNNVIVAGQVGFADHIVVEDDVVVMAKTGVSHSLKKGKVYFGYPVMEVREAFKLHALYKNLPELREKIFELDKKLNELVQKLNESK